MESPKPRRFYLLTYPRTASNLLIKILSLGDQPNLLARKNSGYFFLPIAFVGQKFGLRNTNIDDWSDDERTQMMQVCQSCVKDLQDFVQNTTDQGKDVFVKEHCALMVDPVMQARLMFGDNNVKEAPWTFDMSEPTANGVARSPLNHTLLPDEYLRTFLPTFLIRHPALAFPSQFRAFSDIDGKEATNTSKEKFEVTMTLKWTRMMYDFFSESLGSEQAYIDGDISWPLVVDASDVVNNPSVIHRLAEACNMDTSKLQFEWKPTNPQGLGHDLPDDQSKHIFNRMLSTISASDGIIKGLTTVEVDIDAESKKWRAEFGDDTAEWLEGMVRKSMPDYEYLTERRIRPKSS